MLQMAKGSYIITSITMFHVELSLELEEEEELKVELEEGLIIIIFFIITVGVFLYWECSV